MTSKGPRPGQQGFVLIAVLALLVVLTLLASSVALSSRRAVSEAQADADQFQGELDTLSTQQTLLFMMSTQRTTLAGLTVDQTASSRPIAADEDVEGMSAMPVGNEIRLDGTAYRGIGQAMFALQDGRGLISPNWAGDYLRQAFFRARKVPFEQWPGLEAKRLDYQDPDDLHRLNGAEEDEYRKAGLAPPINRPVATPLEFRRILGWNTLLSPMSDTELTSLFSVERSAILNINSAPAQVLAMLPGMDRDLAQRMVALRSSVPFTSLAAVRQLFPLDPAVEEGLTLFSSTSGNLTLWDSRQGSSLLTHWTMTPFDDQGRPWRIDYEVILPRGEHTDPALASTPATPLFTTQDQAGS